MAARPLPVGVTERPGRDGPRPPEEGGSVSSLVTLVEDDDQRETPHGLGAQLIGSGAGGQRWCRQPGTGLSGRGHWGPSHCPWGGSRERLQLGTDADGPSEARAVALGPCVWPLLRRGWQVGLGACFPRQGG